MQPKGKKTQAKKRRKKITKKINLNELSGKYPKLAKILVDNYGLHCLGCAAAFFETLEDGAKAHGMSDKEIDKMIKKLNKKIEN